MDYKQLLEELLVQYDQNILDSPDDEIDDECKLTETGLTNFVNAYCCRLPEGYRTPQYRTEYNLFLKEIQTLEEPHFNLEGSFILTGLATLLGGGHGGIIGAVVGFVVGAATSGATIYAQHRTEQKQKEEIITASAYQLNRINQK